VGGGNRHDAAAAFAQRRPRVLREQERAGEQNADQVVPRVLVELRDGCDVLEARVRDDRVDPAEALDRRVDDGAVALPPRQVALDGRARAVRVGTEVGRDDVHPVALEPSGDRAADAARRPGDDRAPGHPAAAMNHGGRRSSRGYSPLNGTGSPIEPGFGYALFPRCSSTPETAPMFRSVS